MKRLHLTLSVALLIALGLSLSVSLYLQTNPIFKADSHKLERSLIEVSKSLRSLLNDKPESEWDTLVSNTGYDDQFDIDWYALEDINETIDEQMVLESRQQLFSYDADHTPTMELLFAEQGMVVHITPHDGSRQFLNSAILVSLIIGICAATAFIALKPIVRRLRNLQSLARLYGDGQWHTRNTDMSKDPIGRLGGSMEDMAGKIQHLIKDNENLVQDQRDLMQAVAHEFRAPMARMRFALEMNEDQPIDARGQAAISDALDELNDMVSEVLRYARLQISSPDLNTAPLSVTQLIQECVVKCLQLYPQADIRQHLAESAEPVIADQAQVQRALINLMSNAVKYSTPVEGTDKPVVAVSVEQHNGQCVIHVDDNGPGISPEDRARALKPFVRLESSRSKKLGGTGLGLAIADGVATRHGGSLVISDSALGGARLSLTLPLVR
jgi:signal transduction histidine kinase